MTYFRITNLIIFSTFIIQSCSSDSEKTIEKTITAPVEVEVEPKDFYKFTHLLPESNYSYEVEITKIDFKTKENAFTVSKEKYDQPVKLDGISFTIEYKIKNPYMRIMQVPFPEYFYITANAFKDQEGFIYSKGCRCYLNNQSKTTNSKGKEIYDFTLQNSDRSSAYQRVIEFSPNEVKEFKIAFTEPFPSTTPTITFVGFNQHLAKQVDHETYSKMTDGEKAKNETYNHALVIDIKSKTIIKRIKIKT